MDISLYEEMDNDARSGRWEEIEDKWYQKCAQLSGKEVADRIASVDMTEYGSKLEEQMRKALLVASKESAKAVYFEYDIDNDWDGEFFICTAYSPFVGRSEDALEAEDWCCDWDTAVGGPAMPIFTQIYKKHGAFFKKGEDATYYMIMRTAYAFAKCVEKMPQTEFPICLGFHDQDFVWRFRELKSK